LATRLQAKHKNKIELKQFSCRTLGVNAWNFILPRKQCRQNAYTKTVLIPPFPKKKNGACSLEGKESQKNKKASPRLKRGTPFYFRTNSYFFCFFYSILAAMYYINA
jgi:hypothetical protein